MPNRQKTSSNWHMLVIMPTKWASPTPRSTRSMRRTNSQAGKIIWPYPVPETQFPARSGERRPDITSAYIYYKIKLIQKHYRYCTTASWSCKRLLSASAPPAVTHHSAATRAPGGTCLATESSLAFAIVHALKQQCARAAIMAPPISGPLLRINSRLPCSPASRRAC